jgi:hypothetical protein
VANAEENGIVAYPVGLETSYAAFVPSPGETEFNAYLLALKSNELVGNDTKKKIPEFKARALGIALRVLHTWDFSVLGLHFSSGIGPVLEKKYIDAGGTSFHATSASSLMLEPFDVSAKIGNVSLLASELIYLPLGQHTPSNPASPGLGYTAFVQNVAATWIPNPLWQVSGWLAYGRNTKDHATNYLSGDYLNFDFGASYRPFKNKLPNLAVGVSGFFMRQVSDDRVNGVPYNSGNRMQLAGLGPTIEWDFSAKTGVLIKFQHEFAAKNTAPSRVLWIEFATKI